MRSRNKKKDRDLTYISDKSEHVNTFDEKKSEHQSSEIQGSLLVRLVENFTEFS